jgi:HEAT repeat protein
VNRDTPDRDITAEDLMAELEADDAWTAGRDRDDQARRRSVAENKRDAEPVVADLRAAGFKVNSIADLHNDNLSYREALPVLLRWLPKVSNRAVKEDVVRALSVKWAGQAAAPALLEEFRKAGDASEELGLRWAIGNALAEVADGSAFEELAALASDRRWGRSREMVVVALGNTGNPQAVGILTHLLRDDQVAGHALIALGNLRAKDARADIEQFLDDPEPWIRKEAREALAKIDNG